LRQLLSARNREELLGLLLARVAAAVEALARSRAFNQLGGLQLDKDVRVLLSFFASRAPGANVRRHFARLSQVCRRRLCLRRLWRLWLCWLRCAGCARSGGCARSALRPPPSALRLCIHLFIPPPSLPRALRSAAAAAAAGSPRLPARSVARSVARSPFRAPLPPPGRPRARRWRCC
jgi:hypothetical protein